MSWELLLWSLVAFVWGLLAWVLLRLLRLPVPVLEDMRFR